MGSSRWIGRTPMAYSSPGGTKGSASSGAWAKAARKWSRASSNVLSCAVTLALVLVESLIEALPCRVPGSRTENGGQSPDHHSIASKTIVACATQQVETLRADLYPSGTA